MEDGVKFETEILKGHRLRCPENAEFGHTIYVVVLRSRTAKKCTKSYNARAKPLFCSLNLFFGDVTAVFRMIPNLLA